MEINDEYLTVYYRELGISLEAVRENWQELVNLINSDDKIPGICISWTVDDILNRAEEDGLFLSKKQAIDILDKIKKNHDASTGVNWNIVEYWIDDLKRPTPMKTITLVCGCNHAYDFNYIEEIPGEVPEEITDYTIDDCPNCRG